MAVRISGVTAELATAAAGAEPLLTRRNAYTPAYMGPAEVDTSSGIRGGPDVFLWPHRARMGTRGRFYKPFWPERLWHADGDVSARRFKVMYSKKCHLCGTRGASDIVHFSTTCPAMAQRRMDTLGGGRLQTAIRDIADALHTLAGRRQTPLYLTAAIQAIQLDTPEANFIVSRIVMSAPWRVHDTDPIWTTAARLGAMFEHEYRNMQAVGPFADIWGAHAKRLLKGIAKKWWELLPRRARRRLAAVGHTIPA